MKPHITYAIGDVHGCYDALDKALNWIVEDWIAAGPSTNVRVVFLGDYIDRGPENRKVIERLMTLQNHNSDIPDPRGMSGELETICIRGNHEDLMIGAMSPDTQEQMLQIWLVNGGTETLNNYITDGVIDAKAMTKHLEWMRTRPVYYEDDHRIFVHAGLVTAFGGYVDPLEALSEPNHVRAMKWMFVKPSEIDYTMVPKLVVVGHVAVHTPVLRNNALMLDTGAGKGGDLTVARFDDRTDSPLLSLHPFLTE